MMHQAQQQQRIEIDESRLERLKVEINRENKAYVDKETFKIDMQVDNIKTYLKDMMRKQKLEFADLNSAYNQNPQGFASQ